MKIEKLYIGTWFQRTTLHLSELWKLIDMDGPETIFNNGDLIPLRKLLDLKESKRITSGFECIEFTTMTGISGAIYEDGLILITLDTISDIEKSKDFLRSYYENSLSKGVSYLFSKGAPIPKELANIPTVLPYMFVVSGGTNELIKETFFSKRVCIGYYNALNCFLITNKYSFNSFLGIAYKLGITHNNAPPAIE